MPAARYTETAVVTGATGYVASGLIKGLLETGWNVRGSVRSTDPARVGFLTRLADALPGTLELHEADLLRPGAFDSMVQGADVVFHVASPTILGKLEDPQREVVDPAVNGTENVLRSVIKAGCVRRVVLTGSVGAMLKPKSGPSNGQSYTDDDWNTDTTLADVPYWVSKVQAEKLAWRLAEDHNLSLVCLNPAVILGPVDWQLQLSTRTGGYSVDLVRELLSGTRGKLDLLLVCDLRDVVAAHINAALLPSAKGRYAIGNQLVRNKELISTLRSLYPGIKFAEPEDQSDFSKVLLKFPWDDSRHTRELGVPSTPFHSTLRAACGSVLALGLANPKPA